MQERKSIPLVHQTVPRGTGQGKEKKKESLAQRERSRSCICDKHSTAGRHLKLTTTWLRGLRPTLCRTSITGGTDSHRGTTDVAGLQRRVWRISWNTKVHWIRMCDWRPRNFFTSIFSLGGGGGGGSIPKYRSFVSVDKEESDIRERERETLTSPSFTPTSVAKVLLVTTHSMTFARERGRGRDVATATTTSSHGSQSPPHRHSVHTDPVHRPLPNSQSLFGTLWGWLGSKN